VGLTLWGVDPSRSDDPPAITATATATATTTPTSTPTVMTTATATSTPTVAGTDTPTPTSTPSPTKTPVIARSGLALFPTAYSNGLTRTDGFNLDILFSYFIGSIIERSAGLPNETLNPLRLWLFTADAKYGFLEEDGNAPGLAIGMMDTLMLEGGNATASGNSSGSLKFTAKALGGVYLVASKHVADRSAVHVGYMRGNLADIGGGGKVFKRFLPTGNFSDLMTQFAVGLEDVRGESAPNILFTGYDFRWLGTTWRFEFVKPFPLSKHPFLINSKIDRLFAFNLSYEHWDHGYALLGNFSFRFTILPTTPKTKKPRL